MCDKSRNTWLCVHWQWNTLEWCQLNALQASPVVHLVTPLSCVSLSMNTQPSVPAIDTDVNASSTWHIRDIRMEFYMHVLHTVYPTKYAHGFCFAVLCCGYTLTDFPISIRLTSLALWQSNDCPSASKATLMNVDKYFMWIHYEGLHNHNKAKHNKTVCIFLGIYCK